MNKVNLIRALSPKQQRAINRWFLFSATLIMCTFITLAALSLPHYLTYADIINNIKALQEKTKNHDTIGKDKAALQQEEGTAQNKKTAIARFLGAHKNPYPHLVALNNACKDATLETVRIIKDDCEIIIHYTTPELAAKCMKTISSSDYFNSVKLTSLTNDIHKKKFRCTIKGKITYP